MSGRGRDSGRGPGGGPGGRFDAGRGGGGRGPGGPGGRFDAGRGGGGGRGPPPTGAGRGPPGGGGGRGPGGGRGGGGGSGGGAFGGFIPLGTAEQQMELALKTLTLSAKPQQKRSASDAPSVVVALPRRPGLGTVGRQVEVYANHFKTTFSVKTAYQYDVDIQAVQADRPPRPAGGRGRGRGGRDAGGRGAPPARAAAPAASRQLPARLVYAILTELAKLQGWKPGWASDGAKNIYAATPFLGVDRGQTHGWVVPLASKDGSGSADPDRSFKVAIKYTTQVDLTELQRFMRGELFDAPRAALQVLEVVMRHGVAARDNVRIIGSAVYFHVPGSNEMMAKLGPGVEAWAGYRQAVKPCQFGLSLNLDLAATAFLEAKPLPDLAADLTGPRTLSAYASGRVGRHEVSSLRKALRGVRVEIKYPGMAYTRRATIRDVSDMPASKLKFFNEAENKEQSVAEYYQQRYNLRLKQPNLPCVNTSAQPGKQTWIPMEVCRSVAGNRRRLLDERQTTNMLKFAGLPPRDRRAYLEDVVKAPQLGAFNSNPTVRAFGLKVSGQMARVRARVLPQPRLAYDRATKQGYDPGTTGAWNMRELSFNAGSRLDSWACVSLLPPAELDQARGLSTIQAFLQELVRMLKSVGVACGSVPPLVRFDQRLSVQQLLQQGSEQAAAAFKKPCQLILVVLPSKSAAQYREVKQASDSFLGVCSQCFVALKGGVGASSPEPRGRPQYLANLALKINAKLGGVNVQLAGEPSKVIPVVGSRPFMIFGADVTHPTSFNEAEPSIAAVTGSMDRTLCRYAAHVLVQGHRQEIITDLKDAAKKLLVRFYQLNGSRKPEALLFYRDGVADGQFQEVLRAEYTALRQACEELEVGYCPPITFVVVQKRHNTRLFPTDEKSGDRTGNCVPGTVVDTDICHPAQFDFFLNSHAGLQGHNKAAHYHVLVDENGFSSDGMQLLTYWLCYLYCRCTRSVSYVPPAYYAHLAASRGRLMVQLADSSDVASSVSGASGATGTTVLSIPENMRGTMHYV